MYISNEVLAGVALLDERYPYADWASLLGPDELDVASHYNCPLGQLYGSYHDGLAALDLNMGSMHGFTFNNMWSGDNHAELTTQWCHVVRARQELTAQ